MIQVTVVGGERSEWVVIRYPDGEEECAVSVARELNRTTLAASSRIACVDVVKKGGTRRYFENEFDLLERRH